MQDDRSENIRTFQSFKTYADTEPIISQLTDEEVGRIYRASYGCYFRGETLEFRPDDDRMFRAAWGTFEMKLLSERKKDSETSKIRSSVGREGGKAKGNNKKQVQANDLDKKQIQASAPTYTDTVTGTNSSTTTISSTVTDTEQADAGSADRQTASAAAVGAEPPDGDLFSVKQLQNIVKKNKVDLTDEGIRAFHEEMQESGWILYQKPVEKKYITRALRSWVKYHPEFNLDQKEEPKPTPVSKDSRPGDSEICRSILEKSIDYFPNNDVNDWQKKIVKYCERSMFTDQELELLARRTKVNVDSWTWEGE